MPLNQMKIIKFYNEHLKFPKTNFAVIVKKYTKTSLDNYWDSEQKNK